MQAKRQTATSWLFVLVIAVIAMVAPTYAKQEWIRVATPNFELYTTAGEKRARSAILYFETIRSFFHQASDTKQGSTSPVRIIGFRSKKEFEPFRTREFSSAYYVGASERDYIVMSSISSSKQSTAVHEYVHLLVRHSGAEIPPWLNEGLAVLYSSLEPIAKKARIGALEPGYVQTLQNQKWLDLATLTTIDLDSPHYNERKRVAVFYAQSWALVHMLNLWDQYPREGFANLMHALSTGATPEQAFQSVYGKSLEQVYKDLRFYMRQDRFFAALFDIRLEKAAENPEVRPATPLEAGLVQADLLSVLRDKQEQAKQMYLDLASQNSDSWEVAEGLGYLAFRARDDEEARRHLGRAVELGTTNPRTCRDYGYLLSSGGAPSAEIIRVLEQAVRLQPDYREVRLRLGYLQMREQNYIQGLRHLNSVKRVEKEEAFPLFYAVAFAYYKIGRPDEARKAVKRALEYAEAPSERQQAERLLEGLSRPQRPDPVQAAAASAWVDDDSDAVPHLRRKPTSKDQVLSGEAAPDSPPAVPPEPHWLKVEGTFEQFECLATTARIHLFSEGRPVVLVILDPSGITIRGFEGGSVDFVCGPQEPKSLIVEYEEQEGLADGVAGVVRTIAFQ